MQHVIEKSATTFEHIHRLQELYRAGFQDDVVDSALRKLVEQQTIQTQEHLDEVAQELRMFEDKYALSSDKFWALYQAGKMTDTVDFMDWNIFYKIHQRLLARLSILQGVSHT